MFDKVGSIIKELDSQIESRLLEQIGFLVSRNLLVIEKTEPVLTHDPDTSKFYIKQSVNLVVPEKEYILKLENEIQQLKKFIAENINK